MARNDWVTFNEATLDTMNGVHNFGTDEFSVRLINNDATVPAVDTATPRWADFSANEVAGTGGYTTGGIILTGTSAAEAAGVTTFDDTSTPTWTKTAGSPEDIYWAVLVNNDASNLECPGFLDMGGPVSLIAGDVSIEWFVDGVMKLVRTS